MWISAGNWNFLQFGLQEAILKRASEQTDQHIQPLRQSDTSPVTISLTLPEPSEMAPCAGGVISEDNILLNHSLKVDGNEKGCLLCFLSAVARLILCTKSLGPL